MKRATCFRAERLWRFAPIRRRSCPLCRTGEHSPFSTVLHRQGQLPPLTAAVGPRKAAVDAMTFAVLTIAGAAVLAFANGANDVSKGVATLAGSGRASYRAAIAWGTVWTFAGGLASLVISVGLVKVFTSA